MSKQVSKVKAAALLVGLALAGIGSAYAATIDASLVNGTNDLIDESRETYVDTNTDGLFNAGDVIFGYIRISDAQPSGIAPNNQIYGIFSQQVAATSSGRNVYFEATTVAGLTLNDLLGDDANVGANALAAFYDKGTAYVPDLINAAPGGATDMTDYLDFIRTSGTLQIVAGFADADDFLFSEITLGAANAGISVGAANGTFTTALSSTTLTGNSGAFSILYNNTSWTFNDLVPVLNPVGVNVLAEVAVSSGTTGGSGGDSVLPSPKTWLEAGGTFDQCLTTAGDVACGFTNKNNFTMDVSRVPEPASLSLLGLGLLGMGAIARRRKNVKA